MHAMLDPVIGLLIVGNVALLLASAGIHKLHNMRRFEEIFAAYRLLPGVARLRLSRLIPFLEIGLAAGILIDGLRPYATVMIMGLVLIYAVAIGINIRRGFRDLACGCGGPNDRRPIAAWMVWRNVLLAAAMAISLLSWSSRPLSLMDGITIGFGLITFSLLYLCIDLLLGDVGRRSAHLRLDP